MARPLHPGGLPQIFLDIIAWEVVCGDKNDPTFYETESVGFAKGDNQVRRVLRKWYYGE
jgi:hypothetical protein